MRFELVSYLKGTVMRGREKVERKSDIFGGARDERFRARPSIGIPIFGAKIVVKRFASNLGPCKPQTLGAGLTPKQKVLTLSPRLPLPRFAAIRGL